MLIIIFLYVSKQLRETNRNDIFYHLSVNLSHYNKLFFFCELNGDLAWPNISVIKFLYLDASMKRGSFWYLAHCQLF